MKDFIAGRVIEHTVLHWDSIEDRENTIEQVLLRFSNEGKVTWVHLSNALNRTKLPPKVAELIKRIVERLRKGEVRKGEITKAISRFADAVVNSEEMNALNEKIMQAVI